MSAPPQGTAPTVGVYDTIGVSGRALVRDTIAKVTQHLTGRAQRIIQRALRRPGACSPCRRRRQCRGSAANASAHEPRDRRSGRGSQGMHSTVMTVPWLAPSKRWFLPPWHEWERPSMSHRSQRMFMHGQQNAHLSYLPQLRRRPAQLRCRHLAVGHAPRRRKALMLRGRPLRTGHASQWPPSLGPFPGTRTSGSGPRAGLPAGLFAPCPRSNAVVGWEQEACTLLAFLEVRTTTGERCRTSCRSLGCGATQ